MYACRLFMKFVRERRAGKVCSPDGLLVISGIMPVILSMEVCEDERII